MSNVISARNLTRRLIDHGRVVTIINDVTLDIQRHKITSLTGPSGSGKSTLLYLLGLLDIPSSGQLYINDRSADSLSEEEKGIIRLTNIGYIFQFHFLIAEFSVLANVMLPMMKLGNKTSNEQEARAKLLLDELDLREHYNKKPAQLSGGQRQRVAIARSMANDPDIILADEPTGSLDSKNAQNVFDIFTRLRDKFGKTIIVVTHDLDLAQIADNKIKLMDGKICNS